MNIYEKLNKLQTEVSVGKDNKNDYAKFQYRTIDDIYSALKPKLIELKLAITTNDELIPLGTLKSKGEGQIYEVHKEGKETFTDTLTSREKEENIFILKSTISLINVEEPSEHIEREMYIRPDYDRKGMSYEQMSGSAITYVHKYLLGSLLLLSDKDNADVDSQDNTKLHFKKSSEYATEEQLRKIRLLVSEENIKKVLVRFNKDALEKLTVIEAQQVINQVEK